MRTILTIFIIITLYFNIFAQEDGEMQTVFGDIELTGVYYAAGIKAGYLDGGYIGDISIKGALIYNNKFGIGLGGNFFFQQPEYDSYLLYEYALNGGYGGIYIEPSIFPMKPLHLAFPILAGGGVVEYNRVYSGNYWSSSTTEDESLFLVFEPGVEAEFNLFKQLRAGIGAYYRATTFTDLMYQSPPSAQITRNTVLYNLTFGLTLKFGNFSAME